MWKSDGINMYNMTSSGSTLILIELTCGVRKMCKNGF